VTGDTADYDAFVVKLAGGDGSLLWITWLSSSAGDHGTAVAVGADGDPVAVGTTGGDLLGAAGSETSQAFAVKLTGATGAVE